MHQTLRQRALDLQNPHAVEIHKWTIVERKNFYFNVYSLIFFLLGICPLFYFIGDHLSGGHLSYFPYLYINGNIILIIGAPPWSSSSVLDHRSLPPLFESRRQHIWRLFHLWLHFITFGGRLAHLAYILHKSGRKTSIIILII